MAIWRPHLPRSGAARLALALIIANEIRGLVVVALILLGLKH